MTLAWLLVLVLVWPPGVSDGAELAIDRQDASPPDARGLGLEPASPEGPCHHHGFELRMPDGSVGCSHGPDPAPAGIDLDAPRSLAQLRADLTANDARMPALIEERADGGSAVMSETTGAGTVPCVGFGTHGARVQAVYAYVAGTPSRYAEVAPLIRGWARQTDDIFDASAAQTRGSRHIRWLHDTSCRVSVIEVAMSATSKTDVGQMMAELAAKGLKRADRRYLVWFDATNTGICGIALTMSDDRPGQDNRNNGAETGLVHFGRVDTACWGVPAPKNQVEAHELMHTIGGVQASAPNTSALSDGGYWGHCVDEHETMCYAGATPRPMVYRCPESNERFLDCNHEDYFHTNPPAGSYLATHWNTAMSRFLVRVDPVAGFLDVSTSPFREDIRWIGMQRITRGCSADGERYCEAGTVTREQMASFLARALNLPPATRDHFSDDSGSIHQGAINQVAEAGIARGCASGRFCPRETVTREQMASFLARALKLPPSPRDHFSDDATSIHQGDINRLAAAGITGGCGGDRYCPSAAVRRGPMAAFLRRALA